MNTIRRPRRRPRKSSVSFKTFGWLLVREAYLRIFYRRGPLHFSNAALREIACTRGDVLRRRADYVIRIYPERRYYP